MTTNSIHIIPRNDGRVVIRVESDAGTDIVSSCESLDDVVNVITNLLAPTFIVTPPTSSDGKNLATMIYAYKNGPYPSGPNAYYYCETCGLELNGDDVGFVAAGDIYTNGEFAPCPQCGNEHSIERDDENEDI